MRSSSLRRYCGEVVDGHGHREAGGELGDVLVEQRPIERIRVVVVDLSLSREVVAGGST